MKIKALVVAPYPGLMDLIQSLKPELDDFEMEVIVSDLDEIFTLIDGIQRESYDVIISRGGTAELLRKHCTPPVVDIKVSGFDIMRILTLIKGYDARIEMIGFPNVIAGFEAVSSLMEVDIACRKIRSENDVEQMLEEAKASGIRIVVGDNVTVRKAQQFQLQGVLITSGKESVLDAFSQARQIYQSSQKFRDESKSYENLLNTMNVGCAIIEKTGSVRFANDSFYRLLQLDKESHNLFDQYASIRHLVDDMAKGFTFNLQMSMYDPDRNLAVSGSCVQNTAENNVYYLKVRPADMVDSDIQISYTNEMARSFPPFITKHVEMPEKDRGEIRFPVTIYGESGVGKQLFAIQLLEEGESGAANMLEMKIKHVSSSTFNAMLSLLTSAESRRPVYIQGIENLRASEQLKLKKAIPAIDARLFLSFNEDPHLLWKQGKLQHDLYEMIRQNMVELPPLRNHLEHLDDYIRSFIVMFNEQYGKQIVGIRPEAMEVFYQYAWPGNLIELKDVVEQIVKRSDGEYVEADMLSVLQQQKRKKAGTAQDNDEHINLYQPLEDIERDIFRIVLKQENMNQSKAAQRLGINRSTLWRKLKNMD